MNNDYTHPNTQKRGDLAVTSDGHLQITNADLINDVKVCAMVTRDGDWKSR